MSIKTKVILTTLVFAIPAFILGPQIWPPDPMGPVPTSMQLPFFIVLAVLEAVIFGLGMSFIFYGYPLVQKITGKNKNLSLLVFVSIAWDLVSWWPHDNLHIHNGMNLQGLLYIEYGFHVTLMLTSVILAYAFLRVVKKT